MAPAPNPKEIAKREAVIHNFMNGGMEGNASEQKPKTKRTYNKKTQNVNIPTMFEGILSQSQKVENSDNKASLISRITLNVNTFEPILHDFVKPNKDAYLASMNKKSEQELEIVLKTLEHTRSVYNISTQLRSFVYMGSSAIEYGTQRFMKMKTEGFAQALQIHDQEIRMCLAEYCMDKVDTFQKVNRPEAKLASILVLTLLSVDAKNRMGSNSSSPATAPVAQEVAQEYNDL
jgi:predicted component of type VI protein secretion system